MSGCTSMVRLILFLLALGMSGSMLPAEPIPASTRTVSDDASSFSLEKEEALQKLVSVEATDLSLDVLLKDLSKMAGVTLRATPKVEDQRVTLHLTNQPLHQVMTRLCGLLSHAPAAPRGYFWEKTDPAGKFPATYQLNRDLHSLTEEQEALDLPRRKAVVLLRDMRDLTRMSAEQRKRYTGELAADYLTDPELQPFRDALANASDSQIEVLVESGSIPLDPVRFADKIADFNKKWHDNEVQRRHDILQNGGTDPYPDGVPNGPSATPTITFHVDDYNGEHPERAIIFGLGIDGIQTGDFRSGTSGNMHVTFSPLRNLRPPFSEKTPPDEPIVDLTPLLTGPSITPELRGDVGFTLQVLAKASGISLYQEAFSKTIYWGGRSAGLKQLKGTLPHLLNLICAEWDYHAERVGNDYVLWSNTWAQDRAWDVPERLLTQWRSRFQKQNGFTLDDRIEIATTLTWPQLRLTLNMLLPEAGPWYMRRDAEVLRFLGHFSASEREAMSDQGLPIANMSPGQQQTLLGEIKSKAAASLPDDLLHARLLLNSDPKWHSEGMKRALLEVKSEKGEPLWQMFVFYQTVNAKKKSEENP